MITIYTTVKISSISTHNSGISSTEYFVVVKQLRLTGIMTDFPVHVKN